MKEPEQWAVKRHLEKNPKCEWLCTHTDRKNLGETEEMNRVRVYMDGDKWCAVYGPTFTNIQECPAGFGDTETEALAALVKDQVKHFQADLKEVKI